jgi:hypothetical protein
LHELKRLKVYDFFKLTPQTYDLKIMGDPQKNQKGSGETLKEDKKPKGDAKPDKKKKNKDGEDSGSDDDGDGNPENDKFDPSRKRRGKMGLKENGQQKQSAV